MFFVIYITIFSSALGQPIPGTLSRRTSPRYCLAYGGDEMETALIDTVTDPKSLPLVVSATIIAIGVLGFIVRAGWHSWHEV